MTAAPLAWMADGLCAQTDPELFFPEDGVTSAPARRICMGCEVRTECLEYALTTRERQGVWGGLSARQRRELRQPVSAPLAVAS